MTNLNDCLLSIIIAIIDNLWYITYYYRPIQFIVKIDRLHLSDHFYQYSEMELKSLLLPYFLCYIIKMSTDRVNQIFLKRYLIQMVNSTVWYDLLLLKFNSGF